MTKPFTITRPGLYITRDGRTVEVRRLNDCGDYTWCHGGPEWIRTQEVRDDGSWHPITAPGRAYPDDIVAEAPSPRQAKSKAKPRPVASKPAKRRYVVHPSVMGWCVIDPAAHPDERVCATGMSRADARMFAAMKNTQN